MCRDSSLDVTQLRCCRLQGIVMRSIAACARRRSQTQMRCRRRSVRLPFRSSFLHIISLFEQLTGEVTSWTRCRSIEEEKKKRNESVGVPVQHGLVFFCALPLGRDRTKRTDVQQQGAVQLLVDNVVAQDLVVEGSWCALNSRHCDCVYGYWGEGEERNKMCEKDRKKRLAISKMCKTEDVMGREGEKRGTGPWQGKRASQ